MRRLLTAVERKGSVALLLLTIASTAIALGQSQPTQNEQLALVGGLIYVSPEQKPISDGVVLLTAGKIGAVGTRRSVRLPQGIRTIDCSGLTVVPGLWNSHVHFLQRKWADAATLPAAELERQLQVMLTRYGFTSVFDTWSMWENTRRLRGRIESGEVPGPRIRTTGEAMFGTAVSTTAASWAALGFMDLEKFELTRIAEPADAVRGSKKLLDAGTDGLKFYAATPGRNSVALPEAAMEAGVKEAHQRGKPVFAHPSTAAGLLAAVRAGVDVVTHTTPQSGPWDDAVLAAMKRAGVALIPTLKLWQYEFRHERASLADGFVKTATGQLRAWIGQGGAVLFGTDVGYMSEYDPSEEYLLMAEAGMSVQQILSSLTTAPAERFGVSGELGKITPGYRADITVLRNDPAKDIRAFAAVQYTLRDGKIIYQAPR